MIQQKNFTQGANGLLPVLCPVDDIKAVKEIIFTFVDENNEAILNKVYPDEAFVNEDKIYIKLLQCDTRMLRGMYTLECEIIFHDNNVVKTRTSRVFINPSYYTKLVDSPESLKDYNTTDPVVFNPVSVVEGIPGKTPHIGENNHWYIGDKDTGVSATGDRGEKGEKGEKGDEGTVDEDAIVSQVLDSAALKSFTNKYTIYNLDPSLYISDVVCYYDDDDPLPWSGISIYLQGGICTIQGMLKTTTEINPNTPGGRDILINLPFEPLKNTRAKCLCAYEDTSFADIEKVYVTVQGEDNSVYFSGSESGDTVIPEGSVFCINLSFAIKTDNNENTIVVSLPDADERKY